MAIHSGQVLALGLLTAVGAWLAIGTLSAEALPEPIALNEQFPNQLARVLVRDSQASMISEQLQLTGTTQANKHAQLVFEASGRVVKLNHSRGDQLSAGDIIAELDTRDLQAQLTSARSSVEARRQDLEATRSLVTRGLQNQTQLANAQALFDQARSQQTSLEIAVANSRLVAPFDAVLDELELEMGTFVSSGQSVGQVLNFSPLVIRVEVPEADISKVALGSQADVELLAGGQRFSAVVGYLASSARSSTRTFQVELQSDDDVRLQASGLTARVNFLLPGAEAHFITPALLQLTENGQLAIKIAEGNTVAQYPVSIVRTQTDGIWITGLPSHTQIITRGQGFVTAGDQVQLVQE